LADIPPKLREALRESQTEVAQLKQRGKEKRKHSGDEENGLDQNKQSKKQKKAKDTDDRKAHVRDLGKRFALEYVLWVDTRIVFAADSDPNGQGGNSDNDRDEDAGDNDTAPTTQGFRLPIAEPATGWALKTPEGIDQYTRFQVRRFKQTLEPKDLQNWDQEWFKKQVCLLLESRFLVHILSVSRGCS
jgi:Sec-independent protein translocase protein TatA